MTVREDFPNGIDVYNFEVAGTNCYYVIANTSPVLVHNGKCIDYDGILGRNGGTHRVGTYDYDFPSHRAAKQAASEMAGNLGRDAVRLSKKEYKVLPKHVRELPQVQNRYGIRSADGKIEIRYDYLGHGNKPKHINVVVNGINHHLYY